MNRGDEPILGTRESGATDGRRGSGCSPCTRAVVSGRATPPGSPTLLPNLEQVGLAASLTDLIARLGGHGVDATVEIDPAATFGQEADALLYRAAQEAVSGRRRVRDGQGTAT